jgi:hypothetical protein
MLGADSATGSPLEWTARGFEICDRCSGCVESLAEIVDLPLEPIDALDDLEQLCILDLDVSSAPPSRREARIAARACRLATPAR